ncbi:MAG: hypothetical protein HXS48_25150 [Theionarchaea archaeon]|nr:MAG: hypothetical protein AYK19_05580 [Theionarchaea archaeon DG-70-1]MBU7030245.1 hypothetical protein [Theionarchaea archaeon]
MPEKIVERRGRNPLRRVIFILFLTIVVSLYFLRNQLTQKQWWALTLVVIGAGALILYYHKRRRG